jgi:uncharacterized protein (DUF111 family)
MLILVNVDDISGEILPHVINGLMARGAENVHAIQSVTKKGRLGYIFFIDAPEEEIDRLGSFLVAEVGTIGMRVLDSRHIRFDYRVRKIGLSVRSTGKPARALVRVKEIYNGQGQVVSVKAEYEDLQTALAQLEATGVHISLAALKRLVEQRARGQSNGLPESIHVESIEEVSQYEEDPASAGQR